jgi:two-component system nitrogen regulation sensor histidine kinase NtrY
MRALSGASVVERVAQMRKTRRWRSIGTLGLVILGPVLALATFLVLGPLAESVLTPALRLVLLADLVYILVVAALVLREVTRVIAARRALGGLAAAPAADGRVHHHGAGAHDPCRGLRHAVREHGARGLVFRPGGHAWWQFGCRRSAYEDEHRRDLVPDAQALASLINATAVPRFSS